MGTKTVIDTNVFISAFGWKGNPIEIIRLVEQGDITLLLSIQQLQEINRVLRYPRIHFSEQQIKERMQLIFDIAQIVDIKGNLNVIKEDPSDNIILETAIEHNAEYVITGDKHLLKLKQYKNVKIVTPKEFLLKTGRMSQDREGHTAWIW
ncbi:MAG: putative toxin-antitoxin system toxin component, PIN family, partial [Candidatus Woesearchaeota archaeon]|nr:putative toxin-antitoxin system toxin component, PIN family [Candidatus Woesearchaeota archaeon]